METNYFRKIIFLNFPEIPYTFRNISRNFLELPWELHFPKLGHEWQHKDRKR